MNREKIQKQICSFCYITNEFSCSHESEGKSCKDLDKILDEFDRLVTENKALGEWECCDCGCRFNKPMKGAMGSVPGAMDGVIRCSSCAEGELLRHNMKELKVRRDSEVADAAQKIRDLMDAKAPSREWTLVVTALPDEGDIVMIWDGDTTYIATFEGGNFMEHNAGYDGDWDVNRDVVYWRPLPKPPHTLPSVDTVEQLQAVAFDYDRMYAHIREQLAESGFEILKDDVKRAVGNISERRDAISFDAIIREALGPEKYAEFEKRKK